MSVSRGSDGETMCVDLLEFLNKGMSSGKFISFARIQMVSQKTGYGIVLGGDYVEVCSRRADITDTSNIVIAKITGFHQLQDDVVQVEAVRVHVSSQKLVLEAYFVKFANVRRLEENEL